MLLTAGAGQLPPPAGAIQSVVERSDAPDWIALPPRGQVTLPPGTKLEAISAVVLARDNPRAAALVGALRNRGADLANVSVSLHYIGPNGARIGSAVENEARVSAVARDDLLPFRFPLVPQSELPERATMYKLVLETDHTAQYRLLNGPRVEVKRTRRQGNGVMVTGALHFDTPDGINPAGIVLTLMLTDAKRQILDVVVDRPFRSAQAQVAPPWPFEVRSSMPITKRVRDVKAWVSASP